MHAEGVFEARMMIRATGRTPLAGRKIYYLPVKRFCCFVTGSTAAASSSGEQANCATSLKINGWFLDGTALDAADKAENSARFLAYRAYSRHITAIFTLLNMAAAAAALAASAYCHAHASR